MNVYATEEIKRILEALAQTPDLLPPSVDMFRIGYLRALRDVGLACGIVRNIPQPRRPLPENANGPTADTVGKERA